MTTPSQPEAVAGPPRKPKGKMEVKVYVVMRAVDPPFPPHVDDPGCKERSHRIVCVLLRKHIADAYVAVHPGTFYEKHTATK